MARVLPFAAYLPPPSLASEVVSRAVENYPKHQLELALQHKPNSYLHVINPLEEDKNKADIRHRFFNFVAKGIFTQSPKPNYYIYRQSQGTNSFDGIIALASVADYESGAIKLHEQTITRRENLLAEYLGHVKLNAEPVCFTYPRSIPIEQLIAAIQRRKPYLDFEEADTSRHQIWITENEAEVAAIARSFVGVNALYIADGHHRSASSVRFAHSKRNNDNSANPNEPSEFFMSILFAENQLKIFEFNRLVRHIENFNLEVLLQNLSHHFEIIPHFKNPFEPMFSKEFGLYAEGQWFELNLKDKQAIEHDPVGRLEPEVLNRFILEPQFGIIDLKTDKRVGFLSGKAGLDALAEKVDSGKYQMAFTLFPISVDELFTIADLGLTMPPKSTWVEPKLLSGLTVYDLE